jgi:hypothetical protein
MSAASAKIDPNLERTSGAEARAISSTPAAAANTENQEPPWFSPPRDKAVEWQAFASYSNWIAAQIVGGLLESEGVPTIVTDWTAFPGAVPSVLWLPEHLMHRARWIIALDAPSDAELVFLATGELQGRDDEPV